MSTRARHNPWFSGGYEELRRLLRVVQSVRPFDARGHLTDGADFIPSSDLDQMNEWYRARGLREIQADELPLIGYIAPGVGAGFLYRTDSSIGFLDGFISNPRATSHERFEALRAIGEALAGDFRGRHLLVYTANDGIARWSREHDFTARGSHQLFVRS